MAMYKLRNTPLRGQIEYFLDCAAEGAELDGCSAMTLRLYGETGELERIIDHEPRPHPTDGHYRNRRLICLDLTEYTDRILADLPEERRAGLIRMGMQHLTYSIAQLAETMACWTIEDDIEGGCMENYRTRIRAKDGVPFKRVMRRLMSPKYIRRYVKINAPEHADHLLKLNEIMVRRALQTAPVKPDNSISDDYRNQVQIIRDRMELANQRHFFREVRITRRQRKVIRRSLSVANSLLGHETVSSFLRGETIKLMGDETILMLKKRGSITSVGHGALSVAIADRNGKTLADLCTYIENTPMLDQIVGFALWMQSGEEKDVLETANIIKIAEGAADHPLIVGRNSAVARREIPQADIDAIFESYGAHKKPKRFRHQLIHEERQARNQAYWERTKGEWLEALMVFVIGYRNFHLYKTAGAL